MALGLVLVAALLARTIWLTQPAGALVFDEVYYVNAARVVLGTPVEDKKPYADAPPYLDPNTEHPPLGKVVLAGSMSIFGDNALGWRVPSVIAGMVGLLALYAIARGLGAGARLALLAVGIYALDPLSFIHGRIGTLDMLSLAPLLVGAWLAIRGRWALAGAMLAVGTLVKITGLTAIIAILVWQAVVVLWPSLRARTLRLRDLRPTVTLVVVFLVIGLGGLWALDARYTTFVTPFDHLARIFGYGLALQDRYSPTTITSRPWEWLVGGGQFDYFRSAVNTMVDDKVVDSRAVVQFHAALNPVLIGGLTIVAAFAAWRAARMGDRLAAFGLAWLAAMVLPYVALALLSNRAMYLYYILPAVPVIALLSALFLRRARLPGVVTWTYLAASAAAFAAAFPFRQPP